jgi:hypothetical protein
VPIAEVGTGGVSCAPSSTAVMQITCAGAAAARNASGAANAKRRGSSFMGGDS